jgi:ribosomal-protein-alanine N-acetyltransferase
MKHPGEFESKRLWLRATDLEDAPFIRQLMNTPKWLKYIGNRNIQSVQDAKQYIEEKMLPQMEKLGFGNYTLIRKEDGSKIGVCGLYDRPGLPGVDIGFALLDEFEGKGYAFEAAEKMMDLAFNEFSLTEVKAITSYANKASQKILEKLKMKNKGSITLPDDDEELLLYLLKKEESNKQ